MKIVVISHSCVTDVNQQLYVALNELPGTEVLLVIPALWRNDYTGDLHHPALLPAVTFPVIPLPIAVPGNVSLHFYTRLPLKRLRQFQPDVILSAQEPWSLSGLQAACLSRLLHVPLVFQTNQNIYKKYPPPFSWIEQLSYRSAKIALAYSEEARQVMLEKGLNRPSQVVPYGTDISLFHQEPNALLRSELGVQGKIVIGYVGRIVKEKGLDTLVQAVDLLTRKHPSLEIAVLLVGTGKEEKNLKAQVKAAGVKQNFVFAGAVPHSQTGAYINCMDIFVIPSRTTATWKEQFGRVIVEALACGIPVVGSSSGQIPILIGETGGGLVFREDDPTDLARQLSVLLLAPAERGRLGKTGQASVRRDFTYEAVAAQLHGILSRAVI